MKIGTKAVHSGSKPDPSTGAIMTPIYQTSTFVHDEPGITRGYEYSRVKNPTRSSLESALAELEGGKHGFAFSSGVAAIDTVVRTLQPGDEIICANDIYGGTFRLFSQTLQASGIKFRFVDLKRIVLAEEIGPDTKMIWLESPSNPLLNIYDIQEISRIAHAHKVLVAIDNTFATPVLQQPLNLGADIVVHSASKYLGGHSDVILGGVVVNDDEIANKIQFIQKTCGAIPGPQDCYLVLRGIKTLELRMIRQCENALAIARFLENKSEVDKVYYPGLENHPDHVIAKEKMAGYGGMVSFILKENKPVKEFLKKLKLFTIAESLGGVESLAGHPATMSHASVPVEEREKMGISDSLIRLSVGIENVEDLINDISIGLE